MNTHIPTSDIIIPEEIERVASKTILLKRLLELALWEPTFREGHPQYMTTIDSMDVVVLEKTRWQPGMGLYPGSLAARRQHLRSA